MIPKFAVVGHPNKGKSSIVSTLSEDSSVVISPLPGTTSQARYFSLKLDGKLVYELIDTPGFQRPQQTLDWLEANTDNVSERAHAVRQFVDAHRSDPKFHDECELLTPLLDGAGILYVVDGSKPFGIEYETEMEILRWTGQPRMALINLIDDDDHIEQWRRALDQYFSLVRVFDALNADTATKLSVLRSFGEIYQPWEGPINDAVAQIERNHQRRRKLAAQETSKLIHFALSAQRTRRCPEAEDISFIQNELGQKLRDDLRAKEKVFQRDLAAIYHHRNIETQDGEVEALAFDIFSEESQTLFGLSKIQLAVSGAVSGGVAGTGIDVMVGGTSLFAGAAIGAVIGSMSALFGGDKLSKQKVLGVPLGERQLTVGPFQNPNLPWILLARASLLHSLVSERNHARRDAIKLRAITSVNAANQIDDSIRRELERYFASVRKDSKYIDVSKCTEWIAAVFADNTKQVLD